MQRGMQRPLAERSGQRTLFPTLVSTIPFVSDGRSSAAREPARIPEMVISPLSSSQLMPSGPGLSKEHEISADPPASSTVPRFRFATWIVTGCHSLALPAGGSILLLTHLDCPAHCLDQVAEAHRLRQNLPRSRDTCGFSGH